MKNGAVSTIPAAEWRLDSDLVRLLVVEQCPSWAGLAVEPFANGWDNAMFTLGDKHLVRLPRRAAAVPLLAGEIRWLPELAGRLPVPVPRPVFVGRPSPTFPHPWSVVDRLSGTPAASIPASARTPAADDLADFLLDLHHRAPVDAPANPVRGIALDSPSLAHRARARLAAQPSDGQHSDAQTCAGHASRETLTRRWDAWSSAPRWPGPALWLHGDLHPLNILLTGTGGLAAIIDWGDLTAGDPACDAASAWLMFDAPGRRRVIERLTDDGRYDASLWDRARAWALHLALIFAQQTDDQQALRSVGEEALNALAGEPVG